MQHSREIQVIGDRLVILKAVFNHSNHDDVTQAIPMWRAMSLCTQTLQAEPLNPTFKYTRHCVSSHCQATVTKNHLQ